MFSTKPSQSPAPRHLLQLLQLLQLSINNQSFKLTQQSHARVCQLGLHQHPVVLTNLINAYALSKNTDQSRKLFDSIQVKDVGLWNTYINGFVKTDLHYESFSIFNRMCRTPNSSPDVFTFSTLAKASAVIGDLLAGKCFHGKSVKLGFSSDTILTNSLMSMYNKCDRIQDARKVFDEMPQRTVSSWNIILSGYVNGGNPFLDYQLLELVKHMLNEELKPNEFTSSTLLPFCGFDHGRELHCYIIRNELNVFTSSCVHLACCLIDMYSRCSKVSSARVIFDQTRLKNVFIWTAMMNCYLQNGDVNEVVFQFCEMQRRGQLEPNEVSLLTLLPAANLVAGLLGVMQIHGFGTKKGFINHTCFCNSLIDMYSKNGVLSYAKEVFDHDCLAKDAISWGSMISGYGLHGKGEEAVDLYNKMLVNGIKSDAIHVVGVLSACSRSGLVEKGLDVYRNAISVYGFKPTMEIYSCVVDILARSGRFDEALSFIKTLPFEPGPSVLGAFVNASVVYTSYETSVLGYKSLIKIEPENPSNYVSLSNLYATYRKWDSVAEVRRAMKERSLMKFLGCSWITVGNETRSFSVSDKGHADSGKIYEILNELVLAMKRP